MTMPHNAMGENVIQKNWQELIRPGKLQVTPGYDAKRTATVVADTDLDLLRFDSAAFAKLLEEMPKASERVMTLLRARLSS